MLRVVIDRHIPYLDRVNLPVQPVWVEPDEITPAVVRDADALLIRTRTRCDEALLSGSRVQFIATATIGFDQIDTRYCEAHGIAWTNSPGCNAQGVCDYVESALDQLVPDAAGRTLGVVGVGHVGSLVAAMARRRGFRVLLCDPPRAEKEPVNAESTERFVSLDTLAAESDIVTFHTPLTKEGTFATYHLASYEAVPGQTKGFFRHLRRSALIINAARGGVVDEEALLQAGNPCVIDTWEGEPVIRRELLAKSMLGTYHIAGYTRRGKYNASQMVLDAMLHHFGLADIAIPDPPDDAPHIWDIRAVSNQLKAQPARFEYLREHYPLR